MDNKNEINILENAIYECWLSYQKTHDRKLMKFSKIMRNILDNDLFIINIIEDLDKKNNNKGETK